MDLVSPELGVIFWSVLIILVIILPLIALIDLLRGRFEKYNKLVWAMVVIFVFVLGPILYLFIGRKQKI